MSSRYGRNKKRKARLEMDLLKVQNDLIKLENTRLEYTVRKQAYESREDNRRDDIVQVRVVSPHDNYQSMRSANVVTRIRLPEVELGIPIPFGPYLEDNLDQVAGKALSELKKGLFERIDTVLTLKFTDALIQARRDNER
jgi:hypothetical protein